jgi:hypothetical protein
MRRSKRLPGAAGRRFAADSPLEGVGFEPSVPIAKETQVRFASRWWACGVRPGRFEDVCCGKNCSVLTGGFFLNLTVWQKVSVSSAKQKIVYYSKLKKEKIKWLNAVRGARWAFSAEALPTSTAACSVHQTTALNTSWRSIPHNEPIALRQLQRRHPHQPPRYQSGALLLHELCRRVQLCGCMTDCLTPEEIHYILISSRCALLLTELKALGECRGGGHRYEGLLEMVRSRRDQNTDEQDRQREQKQSGPTKARPN